MRNLKRISHVSLFLAFIMILKSGLSVVLRTIIASKFGASYETDAYYAAMTIPQQLSDFFIGGILFTAIIPVFQKRRSILSEKELSKETSALLNFTLLSLLIITCVFYLFTPQITKLLFRGFDAERQALTIKYTRIFSPIIILFGLSTVYTALCQAFSVFALSSLASLVYPLSSIIFIYFLPDHLGIERLIYGNLLGSFLGLIILIGFISKRLPYVWSWNWKNPLIKTISIVSWAPLMESITLKLIPIIQKNIASGLPITGAITLIEFAFFIVSSFLIFISSPISTAVFPLLGQQHLEENSFRVFETFIKTLNLLIFMLLPINVLLATQSEYIVTILFGYGKFSQEDCIITARLVRIASFCILPSCIVTMTGRVFFVINQTKLISLSNTALVILSCPFYYLLARLAGIYGLVGMYTMMTFIHAIIALIILNRKFIEISFSSLYTFLGKALVCGLATAIGTILINCTVRIYIDKQLWNFFISTTFCMVIYYFLSRLLKIDELNFLIKRMPISCNR